MSVVIEEIELEQTQVKAKSEGKPLVKREYSIVDHVTVEVKVGIGHASITIDELFRATTGTVFTLKEKLNEPVVVYLNEKPIAQGKLVAVGDNFGVQVTQLAD